MNIWVILPTYNEAENLCGLIRQIDKVLQKDHNYKILVVDDNSPDGTGQIAEKLKEKYPLDVLHRPTKMGLGSAYREGFKVALAKGADLIFEMDADFSHNPKDLPRLIKAVNDGAGLAIGSRRIPGGKIIGWSWWRHFCSCGAVFLARFILNLKTKDVTAGFRCYHRRVLEAIDLDKIKSNGYAFQEEMLCRVEKSGFKIKEVPVIFLDRQKGQSKLDKKDVWEFFRVMRKLNKKNKVV